MSAKTPIRGVFDGSTATGLAEFQSGEFIALTHGGLGASLSIGSAGQVLKVNSGASALEFGNVEAIVNIDGATNLESATLAAGDKLLVSDGGTEGRALLSQVDTLFSGTSKTLTNKTISGSSNTLSNIGNSSLSNSSFTLVDTSSTSTTISLGETLKIQGTSNEVDTSVSGDTLTIGLPNNVTIAGNLTVNGTTTTVSSTNTVISDKLLELANGATGTPSGDVGIVIERGSSNNAFIGFDESADKFIVGTGTFTGASTGDLTITTGTLVANVEGNLTGNVTGNTSGSSGSTTGNAATATALETARNINGVSFDGTANIDIGSVTSGSTSITTNLGARTFETESLDTPVGFITINIGGTNYKLPFFNA